MKIKSLFILVTWLIPVCAANADWKMLQEGLELGEFLSPQLAEEGDSKIHVLRIEPDNYEFVLLNTSATFKKNLLSAKQWCQENGLIAGVNASMYQADFKTSVSYMRTKNHINNAWLTKDKTILAFERKQSDIQHIKIIDRECDSFDFWKKRYDTFVQSIRMISCKGKNVWQPQGKKWSTAAIGIDNKARVLFIHARSPFNTHDFIEILKQLPIGIEKAMYAEGGIEAQLYINSDAGEFEYTGMSETGSVSNQLANSAWPIPNIIGIRKRKK
ncbi:phosphodiester glycosidase family protein [bacterium]|nr:phosphodiester glycosidase family protein [bacterium]